MARFNTLQEFQKQKGSVKYDALIVGAGLAGTVIAEQLAAAGKTSLIIESREHIGGNCYTAKVHGIDTHKYGSHIFHSNSERAWNWISRFTKMNSYQHKVMAATGQETVVLPFSMVTFMQLFNVQTVEEAKVRIDREVSAWLTANHRCDEEFVPSNFEEQAIVLVGTTIYEKLIKHYTEKQWGRKATELPAEIIKRLPLRWNCDTTYFNNAKWQGIPVNGYTAIFDDVFTSYNNDIDVVTGCNYLENIEALNQFCHDDTQFVWTGALDELFGYQKGYLEYRSLRFDEIVSQTSNYQGTAVVNFTGSTEQTQYTRITEHKWYSTDKSVHDLPHTVVTLEESIDHVPGKTTPYYPIGDAKNVELHKKYIEMFEHTFHTGWLCGRLADYKYYDMDVTIDKALDCAMSILDKALIDEAKRKDDFAS